MTARSAAKATRGSRRIARLCTMVCAFLTLSVGCVKRTPRTSAELTEPERPEPMPPANGWTIRTDVDELTGLTSYSAVDLYRLASQAFQTGDFDRSVLLYDRLLEEFPDWWQIDVARFNRALALERGRRFEEALAGFQELLLTSPSDAHVHFRTVFCLLELERWEEADAGLARLLDLPELGSVDRLEARILTTRVWMELGELDRAEAELERLQPAVRRNPETRDDPYFRGMVWFHVGEVYRLRAARAIIEQTDDLELAGAQLEAKAQHILEAQQHYIQAIATRSPEWRTAAGYRYAQLFEIFREDMLQAPLPDGMSEEDRLVYRELLEDKTRILLSKAQDVYRRILSAAEARGTTNQWVGRIQESLERLDRELEAALARARDDDEAATTP